MKFWLLLGVFLLVVWFVRGGRRGAARSTPPPTPDAPRPAAADGSEDVVACVHCGVHLPQSEAIAAPAGWFCGNAHRIAHDNAASR